MKKTLMLAALISAAIAMPAMPSVAGEMSAAPAVDAKCVVFPLLPDCIAQWDADAKAKGFHWTPLPNAWWTCKKAEAGAGHLLDCETDTK